MRSTRKLAAVTMAAATVVTSAARGAEDDGAGSPGQEAPADDTGNGGDDGIY